MKKALIIQGGWEGHEPAAIAQFLAAQLELEGFEVTVADTLDVLNAADSLSVYDLISPNWTMGQLTSGQSANLLTAISGGTGLGGLHGGMGDAFRGDRKYEWMAGGHFVGHPYVGEYTVEVRDSAHPITRGLPDAFTYDSEQYYMMIDPGITVLADTRYIHEGRTVTMPVIWTKQWGRGRVFYSALGHKAEELARYPAVAEMTVRGLKWAARTESAIVRERPGKA
ncbi:MAG: ThuA domain-containing protein [Opitutales bacterium]